MNLPAFFRVLLSLTLCRVPLCAQQEPFALRVEVALVNVDVVVSDARGQFVAGLERKNFRIFEDGVEQEITHFASTETPLTLVLLVETSPAVYLIHYDHLTALYALLEHLKPDDAVALARYDQHWQLVCDFTRDKRLLYQRLRAFDYALGMAELNFFDALAHTIDWLAPLAARKSLLLITTGLDTRSQISWSALQEKVYISDLTLFAVATGTLLRQPSPGEAQRQRREKKKGEAPADFEAAFAAADARLRLLTEETGGLAYFPRSSAELAAVYEEIGRRLRHTYSLGYVPTNRARDGSYRRIRVELVGDYARPLPYRLTARRGYFAPTQ